MDQVTFLLIYLMYIEIILNEPEMGILLFITSWYFEALHYLFRYGKENSSGKIIENESNIQNTIYLQRETGNDPKAAALTTLGLSMGAKEILIIDNLHI